MATIRRCCRNTHHCDMTMTIRMMFYIVLFVVVVSQFMMSSISIMTVTALTADQSKSFGYIPSNDISQYLQLANDMKLLRSNTLSLQEKQSIYLNGSHNSSSIITLSSLSLTSSIISMNKVPFYTFTIHDYVDIGANVEQDMFGTFDGHPVQEYSNTLINDLFALDVTYNNIEATAVLIHVIFMAFWSFLYDILYHCYQIGGPSSNSTTTTTSSSTSTVRDMLLALDKAVAIYVGEGQVRHDTQTGYMMYNFIESISGNVFNQFTFVSSNNKQQKESSINTKIMNLFVTLQMTIKDNDTICSKKSDNFQNDYNNLRTKIISIIQSTNIVLIQLVLHGISKLYLNSNTNTNDNTKGYDDYIEMTALAIHPQIENCNSILAQNITNTFIRTNIPQPMTNDERTRYIQLIQSTYPCLQVTCTEVGTYEEDTIPTCNDISNQLYINSNILQPLVSTITTNISSSISLATSYVANIDRDIQQIHILLEYYQWELICDYYYYGYNTYFSLYDIATGNSTNNNNNFTSSIQTSNDFKLYQTYNTKYSSSSIYNGVGNELVQFALFYDTTATITDAIRAGIIRGTMETYIMMIGLFSQFDAAINECLKDSSDIDTTLQYWLNGAAFMIGSSTFGNDETPDNGQSIFAISKRFCTVFDTCEPKGTISNTVLLATIREGITVIRSNNNCELLKDLRSDKIKEFVFVSIVQGLIYYTAEATRGSSGAGTIDNTTSSSSTTTTTTSIADGADAKGYVIAYTMTLLPYIEEVDEDSALILNSMIEFIDKPFDLAKTMNVIKKVLPLLEIDCALIGRIQLYGERLGVCEDDTIIFTLPPAVQISPTSSPSLTPIYVPEEPYSKNGLTWDRYQFTNETIAIMDANFTYDVRDMWFAGSASIAEAMYLNASKYATYGLYQYSNVKSLQDFSTKASLFMTQDPVYNFFRVALFDDTTFDSNTSGTDNGWPYADAIEQLAVGPTNGNNAQLASKTVAVMEFYMMIIHRLYESVRLCESGRNSADLIDAAVGLWIGQEQGMSKFNSGWSMYSVAQDAIQFYGLDEKEAPVNEKLMIQFVEAQRLTTQCSSSQGSKPTTLRLLVDDMVRTLTVPLVQHLLFHMSDNNLEWVELYALAFIPQTISVDEGAYGYLRDALFEGFSWESTVDDYFLLVLGKVLHAMRFTCEDLGDVSRAEENLKHAVSILCNEIQFSYNSTYIAAYETSYDVAEYARLDLDIHQIDIFLRTNAYDLAFDVYSKGRNSQNEDGEYNTLQFLTTTSELEDAGDVYYEYIDYYGGQYVDSIITEVLRKPRIGRFKTYTRRQLSELTRLTLQTMAVYIPIHALLRSAINVCRDGMTEDKQIFDSDGVAQAGQEFVDQAVALFIGSIEGPYSGGSMFASGQMMYALSKDMCPNYSTCDNHGDSHVSIYLLYRFSNMKENLDSYLCDEAEDVMTKNIFTSLPVPLIQGVVYYSMQSDPLSAVATDIYAETILPQINTFSEEKAGVVQEETNVAANGTTIYQPTVIANAIKSVLSRWDVDCIFVGTLEIDNGNYTFCDDTTLPITNTTTDLPDNLYAITTDVKEKTNIALDVKEMLEDISLNRLSTAQSVYNDGRNYQVFDAQGKLTGVRSIASFSTMAHESMRGNPLHQVAAFALQDASGKFKGKDVSQYADTIIQEMFKFGFDSKLSTLPAEAAVALNIWMELANELFILVAKCRDEEISGSEGEQLLDGAVAYWVGGGQISSSRDSGYLLYALAEKMNKNFSPNDNSRNTRTNINILTLFNEAKKELSGADVCSSDPASARRLRRIVDKIISLMIVVNIQSLIHYLLITDERDRVRIYSHAFVPLVAGCSPSTFSYLKEKLINNKYTDTDIESILVAIRSTFPCFGIRCEDVGMHFNEDPSACSNPSATASLADYKPSSDVHEYAKLDLDILELDILLQRNAYEAAYELFSFGKHASLQATSDDTSVSLADLATSGTRSIVPQHEIFARYFSGDKDYANTLVRSALESPATTDLQRRTRVIGISKYMILYISILQAMQESINLCKSSGNSRDDVSTVDWDRAAALIIGHMEGSNEGGSIDGQLFWSLSQRYCTEFDTCSEEEATSTHTNDKITTYLYSGRGAVLEGSCEELKTASSDISSLLLVPIFQGLLSAASKLSMNNADNKELIQAEAYVFSQVLLPLINEKNENNAKTVRDSFPLQGQALQHGFHNVVSALIASMSDLSVKCQYVGSNNEIDTCSGKTSRTSKAGIISGLIVSMITIAAITFFVVYRRKRRAKRRSDTPPVFVMSHGEFNHNSEFVSTRGDIEGPLQLSESAKLTSDSQRTDTSTSDGDMMNDASDALLEEEGMGVAQEAIMKMDQTDEEYIRAIAATLT